MLSTTVPLLPFCKQKEGLWSLFSDVECRLIPVLACEFVKIPYLSASKGTTVTATLAFSNGSEWSWGEL